MTATIIDLAKQVMFLLGKNDANEEPSTEDFADIASVYRYKLAEFRILEGNLCYWIDDEIPDEVVLAMARIVAQEVAPAFSMQAPTEIDEGGQPVSMGIRGLRMLRRITAVAASGMPTQALYFFRCD